MNSKKLLILDCDGVLVRSEEANVAYYNIMFRNFGLPEVTPDEPEKCRLLHTLSTPQVIRHFFPGNIQDEVSAFAGKLEFSAVTALITPEPGWSDVLGILKKRMKVCVATNRGRSAPGVIESVGLSNHIDRIFMVHEVVNPKPAPDLLHLAASVYGVEPGEAFYVGDSDLDRRAAASAGVPFIGFRIDGDIRINHPCELETLC